LLRFARKTPKNRPWGDFLPCKLRRTEGSQAPDNRDFFAQGGFAVPRKKFTSATGSLAVKPGRVFTDLLKNSRAVPP
jgi:hypothetical protein